MGVFFRSFDEAWSHFLARDAPLEDFFASVPPVAEAWFVLAGDAVREAARPVQEALAALDGLTLVPPRYLHVTLAGVAGGSLALDVGAFEIDVGRVNCFHDAVVAEVAGVPLELMRRLAPQRDLATFLPHVTLAVFRGEPRPEPLRELLVPLRERRLARERVDEIHRCRIELARDDELIARWDVLESIALG